MKKNYPKNVVGTLKDQRAPIRIFPKPLLCFSYHADKLSNITPLGEIACTDYVSSFMDVYIWVISHLIQMGVTLVRINSVAFILSSLIL